MSTPLKTPAGWHNSLKTEAWEHAAADTLHGWRLHEHHEVDDLLISEADYRESIEAAKSPKSNAVVLLDRNHRVMTVPGLVPHGPACSKHSPAYNRIKQSPQPDPKKTVESKPVVAGSDELLEATKGTRRTRKKD